MSQNPKHRKGYQEVNPVLDAKANLRKEKLKKSIWLWNWEIIDKIRKINLGNMVWYQATGQKDKSWTTNQKEKKTNIEYL